MKTNAEGCDLVPHDTVMEELRKMAAKCKMKDRDMAIAMAVYSEDRASCGKLMV